MKETKSDSSCIVGVGCEQSAQHNSLALIGHALLCQSCWVPCAAKPSGFMNLAQWMLPPLSATEKLEAQLSPEQSQPSSPPAEGQHCSIARLRFSSLKAPDCLFSIITSATLSPTNQLFAFGARVTGEGAEISDQKHGRVGSLLPTMSHSYNRINASETHILRL